MKDNVLLRTENMSRKYVISDRRETEIEVLKDINQRTGIYLYHGKIWIR